MADLGQDRTALGIARARFMDGLPRKAKELKAAVTLLLGTPDAERPREEMRRRLHALYASAQVFQEERLAQALRDAIALLDAAREQHRGLLDEDLDALVALSTDLPNLGTNPQPGTPSVSVRPRQLSSGARPVPPPTPPQAQLPQPPRADREPVSARPRSLTPRPPSVVPRPPTSTRPAGALTDVISVLVVDDLHAQSQVTQALPADQFEVIATPDVEEALRLCRAAAPDVVLVGAEVVRAAGGDLIARLRSDPLTDFVPVILLWPSDATYDPGVQEQIGADDTLRKPIDAQALLRRIAALTSGGGRFGDGLESLHHATVEEVADRVAREIRQGIVDSLQSGREHSIPLGDGTDILAAAWSAIGRIRAHLSHQSGGLVRFRDAPRRGGPAILALVGTDDGSSEGSVEHLRGRRVLVADDDPAVLWFFSGLLKEAGMTVFEAADGRSALEQTRRQRPDVVVSDILMPEVDGFALCRELKRDVAVAHIPVILLSWKEDFLQRMRELQSGASGYLLKEAGGRQILTRILEVLRPRLRLEEQLRAGGELRGRLDDLGIMTLLEAVAAQRPDSRVTVRDAWNLFELDLRKGNLVTLSRTSTDGSFARGDVALRQLLGAKSGRFTVTDSDTPVRPIFEAPLTTLLSTTAQRLSALLDAVSDTRLMQIHQVAFDDPTLAAMVTASPQRTRDLLERLRGGASPRQLIIDGEVPPHEVESCLDDAARRGALTGVSGADDQDLVAAALSERERDPGALMHSNRPPIRATPVPPAPTPTDETPELPSSDLHSEPPGPMHAAAVPPTFAGAPTPTGLQIQERSAAITARPPAEGDPVVDDLFTADVTPVEPLRTKEMARVSASPEPSSAASQDRTTPTTPAELPTVPVGVAPTSNAAAADPLAATMAIAAVPEPSLAGVKQASPQAPAAAATTKAPAPDSAFARQLLFFLLLVGVGYGGYQMFLGLRGSPGNNRQVDVAPTDSSVNLPVAATPATAPALTPAAVPPPVPSSAADEPSSKPVAAAVPVAHRGAERDVGFGRVLSYIDTARGVQVRDGEGLLVVEANPAVPNARVRLGDRDLGTAPVSTAIAAGRHELIFQRGDDSSFRYLVIRAGETRIVQVP